MAVLRRASLPAEETRLREARYETGDLVHVHDRLRSKRNLIDGFGHVRLAQNQAPYAY